MFKWKSSVSVALYDLICICAFSNNSCISFLLQKDDDPTPFHIKAEMIVKTNFYGTKNICKELLPLIKPQGKHYTTFTCCSKLAPEEDSLLFTTFDLNLYRTQKNPEARMIHFSLRFLNCSAT